MNILEDVATDNINLRFGGSFEVDRWQSSLNGSSRKVRWWVYAAPLDLSKIMTVLKASVLMGFVEKHDGDHKLPTAWIEVTVKNLIQRLNLRKEESSDPLLNEIMSFSTTWILKASLIARHSGSKDRHQKALTSKRPKDQRIKISAGTDIILER